MKQDRSNCGHRAEYSLLPASRAKEKDVYQTMNAYKYPVVPFLRTFDLTVIHLITGIMQCPCSERSVRYWL